MGSTIVVLFLLKISITFIKENLASIYPFLFLALTMLFLVLVVRVKFRVSRMAWTLFAFTILFQILFVPHYHIFNPDDYWLMDQAKNTILKGASEVCEYNVYGEEICILTKSSGYPTILSIPFIILGLNNYVAMWFSVIFSSIFVIVIYLFAKNYFESEKIGLLAAFLIMITNLSVYISSHVDNIHAALIFISISMTALVMYSRNEKFEFSLLAAVSFLMSIFIRVEFAIFIIPFIVVYFNKGLTKKETLIPFALMVVFLSLFLAQISTIASIGYNSGFDKENVMANLGSLNIGVYEIIIILLIILAMWRFKNKTIPLLTALLVVSLFYFSWTQTNIIRVMLTPIAIMVLLMAAGLKTLLERQKVAFYLVLVIFIGIFIYRHVDMVKDINNSVVDRLNTETLNKIEFKQGCYVLIERPVFITATNDVKAISTMNALSDLGILYSLIDKECVLFYENNYCFQKLDPGPGRSEEQMDSPSRCYQIKKDFKLTRIQQLKGYNYVYGLYEVSLK